MIGNRLGVYEVTAKLGEGGMGEVYRARDTKLDRDVALKVLPAAVTADPERLARFEREAKVLASLNHPHIGGIYGLEESDGTSALVLELVEGPTLGDRIAQGPIPLDEALPLARQIAAALEAAHEQGIVHRDLKPANVKVRPDDTVKVLDFGLAKELEPRAGAADADLSRSPTLTAGATELGVILGTAPYMAPEQARGRAVDRRADIWAFGCVLYEMLTGRRAFSGGDVTDILASILRSEPDWDALPDSTPLPLVRLLRRCLAKAPAQRLQHIGDARLELTDLETATDPPDAVTPSRTPPRRALLGLAIVAALALGLIVGRGWRWSAEAPESGTAAVRRTAVQLPGTTPLLLGVAATGFDSTALALSPSGQTLVYVGSEAEGRALFVRDLDSYDVRRLPGTEGARHPFFSPNGEWVGFLTDEKVGKVSLHGESSIALCDARSPVRATWMTDDLIYFSEDTGLSLSRVSAQGGRATPLATQLPTRLSPARFSSFSDMLPGGRWALITLWQRSMSGDYADVVALDVETGETKTLLRLGHDARYLETGHLVFVRGNALLGVPFDAQSLEIEGEPVSLVPGVATDSLFGQGQFGVARRGDLAYVPGGDRAVGALVWIDRQGAAEPLDIAPQIFGVLSLSPEGRELAVEVADLEDFVRLHDLDASSGGRRFATGGQPVWSPDGGSLTYSYIADSDQWTVSRQPVDRSREPEILLSRPSRLAPSSWSPDGRTLAITDFGSETTAFSIGLLQLGDGHYETDERGGPLFPVFSPDGSYLAFGSTASGRNEIWVRPVAGGPARQVSTEGGWEPLWNRNGELFWRTGNQFWSTRVITRPELSFDPPTVTFETDFVDTQGRSYDVSPDGERLLVVKRATAPEVLSIHLVESWFSELERSVPAR